MDKLSIVKALLFDEEDSLRGRKETRMRPSALKHAQIEHDDSVDYMLDEEAIAALVRAGACVEEEDKERVIFSNLPEPALQKAKEASAIRRGAERERK